MVESLLARSERHAENKSDDELNRYENALVRLALSSQIKGAPIKKDEIYKILELDPKLLLVIMSRANETLYDINMM